MIRVPVAHASDVVMARRRARELAREQGLEGPAVEALATAVTEVAQNILVHAVSGEVILGPAAAPGRRGVVVVARDEGPGVPDPAAAMQEHYSTGGGLGLGLPAARALVDELEVASEVGVGTTVTLTKWAP